MIDGLDDLIDDFQRAAATIDLRVSSHLLKVADKAIDAAKRSVPRHYGGTRASLTVGDDGKRPTLGDTDVVFGSDKYAPDGRLSAAGWLTFGNARRGPTWDFYGQVERPLRALDGWIADEAGDV